ncbi:MAG TPA: metallophosphoesterase, partial [Nocardioides sp.]|nr:metallophosphoesterase [Nocardioides sp.]
LLMTTPSQAARPARAVRLLAALALGLVGGWLGLTVAGTVHHEVGPLTTSMRLQPSWGGGTVVVVPPLGELRLDTHTGVLGVRAALEGLDVDEARALVAAPEQLGELKPQAVADIRWALTMAVVRAGLAATVGAALLGGLAFRRVGAALLAGVSALAAVGGSAGVAVVTANPASIAEPRYTGLLADAPAVVGTAESIVTDFSRYGDQLAQVVRNVSGLYAATSTLPLMPASDDTVRLLHVSDLHLAPQAWDTVRTVADQYDVDAVVDSGDITDHGSRPENRYVQEIRHLDVPYVWVRGNHDSAVTQRAMARQRNVVVLDGRPRRVAGLTFLGVGDPTFTPDKTGTASSALVAAAADRLAEGLERHGDVDVAVFHDPTPAAVLDGLAPISLHGHLHYRKVTRGSEGTWFMVQGSTGGSGLRALEPEEPAPILLSVLYVDRATGDLRGYDDIRVGGLGSTSAQIQRHVVDPLEPAGPETALVAPGPSQEAGPE